MNIRISTLVAVPVTVLLMLLTACTGGGQEVPSQAPTPTEGPKSADINSQPRNILADGGELRIPVQDFGDQWNPLHKDATDPRHSLIMGSLVPRLFNYDAEGNPSPNPDYLSAVHATGENPQVVTYTLNPNAAWGNGRPIGAIDFIADWKACNGQNVSFECANTNLLEDVASIEEGANPQQVVVTYEGAFDAWPSTFAYLLPAGSVKDPKTFNQGWTDLNDVGDWLSGPYVVSDFDPDNGLLTEVPNPNWWAEQPKLAQVTFRKFGAHEQSQAFQDHQVDVADISDDSDETETINALPDGEVRVAVDSETDERELIATRTTLANFGAFGRSSIIWPDVGYLPPNA